MHPTARTCAMVTIVSCQGNNAHNGHCLRLEHLTGAQHSHVRQVHQQVEANDDEHGGDDGDRESPGERSLVYRLM